MTNNVQLSLAAVEGANERMIMAKEYFNEGGVVVNSAMLITADGAQYPVRNISSVRIGGNKRTWWRNLGFAGLVFAAFSFFARETDIAVYAGGISACMLVIWYFLREVALVLSTAGVDRVAI
ncbi:MAG: hypothetical protein R3D63_07055 [Paracoccaceae bacterium]